MAFPQRKRTPSFSSSILDSIYRSIDQSDSFQQHLKEPINENNTKNDENNNNFITLRRAIMDDEHSLYSLTSSTTHSSSSSSDSSTFSSSEVSSYKPNRRNKNQERVISILNDERVLSKCLDDNKIKAAKMLKEIKKTKQPVSPGARLTNFLNSLFQSNAKKVKLCSVSSTLTDVKSSSSRSCFRTNNCNNNMKRSVKDCKGSVHKQSKKSVSVREITCRARKVSVKNSCVRSYREEEEEDVWSCSSSDLFELPVYETTDFKTNQDIARGFFL